METGDQRWAQGNPPREYDRYESINLDDTLYSGYGDDQIGGGHGHLVALEFDGELRWENDTGSTRTQPSVGNGIVSVGNDMGVVYAFDSVTGEELWTYQEEDTLIDRTSVVAITDTVYATVGKPLTLDADDGSIEWSSSRPRSEYPDSSGGTIIAFSSFAELVRPFHLEVLITDSEGEIIVTQSESDRLRLQLPHWLLLLLC